MASKSNGEIKPKSKRGGRRAGAGRKSSNAKAVRSEVSVLVNAGEGDEDALSAAFKALAPQCVRNLATLANGGYQRVEEKWEVDEDGTTMKLVEKKVSYAEPDRAANAYIVDRVLGKPKQAVEVRSDGFSARLAMAEQVMAEHVPDARPEIEV